MAGCSHKVLLLQTLYAHLNGVDGVKWFVVTKVEP